MRLLGAIRFLVSLFFGSTVVLACGNESADRSVPSSKITIKDQEKFELFEDKDTNPC
jgi:hypothetical protein